MSTKLKDEINLQSKNIRNPNMQKLFKGFYYDKDKIKVKINGNNNNNNNGSNNNKTAPTSATTSSKS